MDEETKTALLSWETSKKSLKTISEKCLDLINQIDDTFKKTTEFKPDNKFKEVLSASTQ